MFCFFPVLCLKAQDVDFSLTREGNKVIYKVINQMDEFILLHETYVDLGTGSHLYDVKSRTVKFVIMFCRCRTSIS